MSSAIATSDLPQHSWIYRRAVLPLAGLLRLGASPQRLAWSLAIGIVVGINPVLGSTTVACLAIASALRLNLVASQLTNHLVYPLQLLLVLPFLEVGARLFRTPAPPLSPAQLLHLAHTHPVLLCGQLWTWECHALTIWLLVAAITAPLLAISTTPLLRRLQARVRRHESPLASV